MDAKELRATLETKMSKAGKPYQVICIYLTDTYKKQVFLEEAEKELLKQYLRNNDNNNLEMPDLFN